MASKAKSLASSSATRWTRALTSRSSGRSGTTLYGKTQRRTSKFLAHDETNEAKVGDRVAIVETRPLSRRKRWVVTRVVEKAKEV